ncbi:centromere protein W-like [Babylonia areolata]|uniref:centromere protein W-like n=1 Tax=Babylonia areolata TaxID=304850 RepID=UPI003FD22E96
MIPAMRKAKIQFLLKKSLRKARMKKSVDAMAWLNYILFLKMLASECQTRALSEKSKVVTTHHVKAVRKLVIRKLRG